MKIAIKILLAVLALTALGTAQTTKIRSVTSLPATCSPGTGVQPSDIVALVSGGTTALYNCKQTNTWSAVTTNLCSIAQFNPAGDGTTDDSAVFTTASATCKEIWLSPNTSYFIGTSIAISASLRCLAGSKLIIGAAVTLTENGNVRCPNNAQLFQAVAGSTFSVPKFTQTATDNFTRANENPNSFGGKWTAGGGGNNTGQIVSNKLEPQNTSTPVSVPLWTGNGVFSADQYSEVTVATNSSNDGNTITSAVVRGSLSAFTYYDCRVVNTSANNSFVYIDKTIAGVSTVLYITNVQDTFITGGNFQHAVAGDVIRFAAIGTQLFCYYNSVLLATVSDSSIASGYPGALVFSTVAIADAQLSNWNGGTVAAPPAVAFGNTQLEVYPEWFGAVGNGVTDDTAPLQQSINSISGAGVGFVSPPSNPGGATVFLQAKTYATSYPLSIMASFVSIKGVSSRRSVILNTSGSRDTLVVEGTNASPTTFCSFNRFERLSLERNTSPSASANGLRISFGAATTTEYFDSWDSFTGISVNQSINTFLSWTWTGVLNQSTVAGNIGFFLSPSNLGTFSSTRIIDSFAIGGSSQILNYGMYVRGDGHPQGGGSGIADLYVEGLETGFTSYGTYIASSRHSTGLWQNDNVHFIRCIHDTFNISGFFITGAFQAAANIDIDSSYISGSATQSGPGIDIENSSGVTVRGSYLRWTTAAATGVLINGANSYGNVIESTNFTPDFLGAAPYCISINTSNTNVIANNIINSSDATHTFTVGIKLVSANRNVISGNELGGWGTTGLNYDAASGNNASTGNVVDTTNITTAKSDLGTANGAGI